METPILCDGDRTHMVGTVGYAFITFYIVSILTGVNIQNNIEMYHRVESRVGLHNSSASLSSSTFLTQKKTIGSPVLRRLKEKTRGFFCIMTVTIVRPTSPTHSLFAGPVPHGKPLAVKGRRRLHPVSQKLPP